MAFVIIPAYKPDRTLISLAEQMWDTGCRIVVVDDGSGEEYQDIFEEISDVAVILRHPENRGKGAAIKSALAYIEEKRTHRDVVGVMDADGQHLPEDMLKLLEAAEEQGRTLVLGVRNVGHKMPLRSRLGNKITRTAIGYYEPGHYCLLLVDGRQSASRGMFPGEMSVLFKKLGCQKAYNLDGGHCSFMVYRGNTVNHPYKPEKQVSDGIVITEGLS